MSDQKKSRRQSAVTNDLIELADRLTEIAIEEANPDNWPGKGFKLKDMDKNMKGDRYWCKQNATGTVLLIKQLHNLISQRQTGQAKRLGVNSTTATGKDDVNKEVDFAEQEAMSQMTAALNRAVAKVRH